MEELSIDSWRGQCLNYFARAEQAIGKSLEQAHAEHDNIKLRHLAGQRLADLIALAQSRAVTEKQKQAFEIAFENWQSVEAKRLFLAHGVASVAHDQQGHWVLLLDSVVYRSNIGSNQRWAVRQKEAEDFLKDLATAFKALTGQLGQFRSRIKAA